MPIRNFTRSFLATLASESMGALYRLVQLDGFKYGSLNEIKTGITSVGARTPVVMSLVSAAFDWRGIGDNPQLKTVSNVVQSLDGGMEFSFEWAPITGKPEDIVGTLAQTDVTYAFVEPNLPTTCDHGYVVDSVRHTANGINGLTQTVTPGGVLWNGATGRTFTFSLYVARPDLQPGADQVVNVRFIAGAQSTLVNTTYTAASKWYQRVVATWTATSAAGAATALQIICGVKGATPGTELLFAAAQLEEAGAATAYERTQTAVRGVRNILLQSHFPTRAPWTTQASAGTVIIVPDAGRGPEVRAIVPTPGTIEFGSSRTGAIVGNGIAQLRPYDADGQVADKFTVTATASAALTQIYPGTITGNTFIGSMWIRAGTQTPTNNWYINLQANDVTHTYVGNKSIIFTPAMLTRAWRRVWVSWYVTGLAGVTELQFAPIAALTTFTAGDNVEIRGCQLEVVAGNNPRPPSDYQPTGAAGVGVNLLLYSDDLTNAVWSKTNGTITANTGYAPIEYYDFIHPDVGVSANRLRINGGTPTPAADYASTTFNAADNIGGIAYSTGSYGTELMGTTGNFNWAAAVLTGWTITGGSQYFLQTDGAPSAWIDDEESTTPQGVKAVVAADVSGQLTPGGPTPRYISASAALVVGWHTIRLRVARAGTISQNEVVLAIQAPAAGNYLGYDCVSWPDTTIRWMQSNGTRDQAINSPDFGLSVWHLYVPTAGTYTIRLGAIGSTSDMLIDQLRIWSDAGALYASTDRTETLGNCGFLVQGLNTVFRGVCDETTDADDVSLKVRCRDYIHGTLQEVPLWKTQPNCQIKFRGTECGYLSTTTFTATSVGNAHTVADTSRLVVGRLILNKARTGTIQILTIPTTTTFTTDSAADVFVNGDILTYADCKKTYDDCDHRQRTFRYAGTRATVALQSLPTRFRGYLRQPLRPGDPRRLRHFLRRLFASDQSVLGNRKVFDDEVVPIVYGRKSLPLQPVESHATKFIIASLWKINTSYTAGTSIVTNDSGKQYRCITSGTSAGSGGPTGTTAVINDNTVQWAYIPNATAWHRSTSYTAITNAVYANGKLYRCITSGTSSAGGSGPSTTVSDITDGTAHWAFIADGGEWLTTFYLMGYGEVDSVRAFFTPDGIIEHAPDKGVGVWWHPGTQGEDAWWTVSDYRLSPSTQKIPNQKRDFRTNTDNTYNRMAYAITQIQAGDDTTPESSIRSSIDLNDPTNVVELWVDGKFMRVQVYDANGSPVGSPAWSRNPVWLWVHVALNGILGPALPKSCIDWYQMAAAAALCDATITSTSAYTQLASTLNSNLQRVISTADFAPEMPCQFYSSPGNPTGALNKVLWMDPIEHTMYFETSVNGLSGWIVQGLPARYTCDLAITSSMGLADLTDLVLSCCRGVLAFDGGRIGIYIEKGPADTSATTWTISTPTPADKLGVVEDSVHYDTRSSATYNVLEATYTAGQLISGTDRVAKFVDADRGGLDFPRILKLDASGCDTGDQALRSLLPTYAKACATLTTASDTPRGFSLETGPSMLRAQISDFATLTRVNRSSIYTQRIIRLSLTPKLRVLVEALPEVTKVRSESYATAQSPWADSSGFIPEQGSALTLALLTLSIVQNSAAQLKATVTFTGYTNGPGSQSGDHLSKFASIVLHASLTPSFIPVGMTRNSDGTVVAVMDMTSRQFIWNPPASMLEVPLYLIAVGMPGLRSQAGPIYSAEVPITIYRVDYDATDGTQGENDADGNMIYDGDFQGQDYPAGSARNLDGWVTNSNAIAATIRPNAAPAYLTPSTSSNKTAAQGYTAYTNPANGADVSNTTFADGIASKVGGTIVKRSVEYLWAAATKTGRVRMRGESQLNSGTGGSAKAYVVATDAGGAHSDFSGYWSAVATPSFVDMYSIRFVNCQLGTLKVTLVSESSLTVDNNVTGRVFEVVFEEEAANPVVAHVVGGKLELRGDGTTGYAEARRRFPGKNPVVPATYLTTTTPNRWEIKVQRLTAGAAPTLPLEIWMYDTQAGTSWQVASIPADTVDDSWSTYTNLFVPATDVAGLIEIFVRTLDTNGYRCDQLMIKRELVMTQFQVSSEDQQLGRYPDLSAGRVAAWPKGKMVADPLGTNRKTKLS